MYIPKGYTIVLLDRKPLEGVAVCGRRGFIVAWSRVYRASQGAGA